MDPLASVDPRADTSYALMAEAERRGHTVFHLAPGDVGYAGGECRVLGQAVSIPAPGAKPQELGEAQPMAAASLDTIWVRTDPPFDADYLHVTQLLALAEASGTLVINRCSGLQAANEHLYMLAFPELTAPSLISARANELFAFMDAQGGQMVLKPIDGHGGFGVLVVSAEDRNRHALVELLTDGGARPVLAQAYLPEVRAGDKRVLLLDGSVLGAVNRVPTEAEHRGNLHVGGLAEKSGLTATEEAFCEALAPRLREDGLFFVGLDFIGEVITEINVTSPTGIQEMSTFDEVNYCGRVWEWVEARCG